MKKQKSTMGEAFEAFMVDECLSSSEEEVNLDTEQDFTDTDNDFFDSEADSEIEIESFPDEEDGQAFTWSTNNDNDNDNESELTPEEIAYLHFLEDHLGHHCNCQSKATTVNERLIAVIELARFGQTCTNDKQRETILDILWMCAMDRFIK